MDAQLSPPRERPGAARRPLRVLIVDDSEPFRLVAAELLARRGYVVAGEAITVADAIDAVERLRPDAVLLDTVLPDGNGMSVAAALQESHPAVAILLVSADPPVNGDLRAEQSGARGFVMKSELARVDLGRYWPDERS